MLYKVLGRLEVLLANGAEGDVDSTRELTMGQIKTKLIKPIKKVEVFFFNTIITLS